MYYYHIFNPFEIIFQIIGVVLLVALAVRLFAGPRHRLFHHRDWDTYSHSGRNSALTILEERYAKGEIDKAEFDSKKKDLIG